MNKTDKQIIASLLYIKNNPDCTTRGNDLDESIVHYLYEQDLVKGNNTLSSSSDKGAKHEYSFLSITTQGEMYLESNKEKNSPLNIFKNKTFRFVVATIFVASIGIGSKLIYDSHKTSQEQDLASPSETKEAIQK